MLKVERVLLTLCVVIACSIRQSESIRNDLDKINKNLVAKVPTPDFNENVKALKDLLRDSKRNFLNPFNIPYMNTLERLVSLEKSNCDVKNFAILKEINDSLGDEARKTNEPPIRRISAIVRQLSIQHAKDCQLHYEMAFEAKNAGLEHEKVLYVQSIANKMYRDGNVRQLYDVITTNHPIKWRQYAEDLYKALVATVGRNDDSKYLRQVEDEIIGIEAVDKEKFKIVYNKYLLDPCKYYVNNMGPEVFIPIKYDARLYHNVDESKKEFYIGWAGFELCDHVVENEVRLFKLILERAEKRSPIRTGAGSE